MFNISQKNFETFLDQFLRLSDQNYKILKFIFEKIMCLNAGIKYFLS